MSGHPNDSAENDPMKQTLFIGEYTSRNVGDGIIKLAIEKLCAKHDITATFRDFYGGTPALTSAQSSPPDSVTPKSTSAAPPAPSWPQRLWHALMRIPLVTYAIALLFHATRHHSNPPGTQAQPHQ